MVWDILFNTQGFKFKLNVKANSDKLIIFLLRICKFKIFNRKKKYIA